MPMSASDNKTRAAAAIIGLIILLLTEGCIMIPTPWVKGKYTQEDLSGFTAGLSTKDDVLNKFGPPDIIWETERVYVYRWNRKWGVTFFYIFLFPVFDFERIDTDEALLVLFDQEDRVVRIEQATRSTGDSFGKFLTKWRNQQKE